MDSVKFREEVGKRIKTIILKKDVFEKENISIEESSWLVHEVGHVLFYDSLGDDVGKYMDEYYKKNEYTNSFMESSAFQLQFDFLKNNGKSKDDCIAFVKSYLNESFGEDQEMEKMRTEGISFLDQEILGKL